MIPLLTSITPEVIILFESGGIMLNSLTDEQISYIQNLLNGKKNIRDEELNAIMSRNVKQLSAHNDIYEITDILKAYFTDSERKQSGITFTPLDLVVYAFKDILKLTVDQTVNKSFADLSLGNGAFFIGLLIYLKEIDKDFKLVPFINNNIYGIDIKEENIFFARLNLKVLVSYFGEDASKLSFNFQVGDSIKSFLSNCKQKKYNYIIGNPPYVKQQNLPFEYRRLLLNNFQSITSNYNIYYAFVEMTLSLLSENGVALYLLPNYLLKIKSAQKLRKILIENSAFDTIVDFGPYKMFHGVDTYSMLLKLTRNSSQVKFKTADKEHNSIKTLQDLAWTTKRLTSDNIETINLTTLSEDRFIQAIQGQEFSLDISTGIATQKDKLYLIDERIVDKSGKVKFFKTYDDQRFEIENEIVVKIIKGSGASKSANIKEQYIIYPYQINNGIPSLISINDLKDKYPKTYNYFVACKQDLSSRSGVFNDDDWYRYGRSQALTRFMPKIVFPTNTQHPQFKYFQEKALFYNGYAVYGLKNQDVNDVDMQCITKILNSEIIDRFMHLTSYYIGGGYISYQKKYLSKVTIPALTARQKDELISSSDKERINRLLYDAYGIDELGD